MIFNYSQHFTTQPFFISNITMKSNAVKAAKKKSRRVFSLEEDQLLFNLVQKYGENDWGKVALKMHDRNPRQCKERWTTYLSPSINKSPWTEEEDLLLQQKFDEYGPKWATIAAFFKGRPDNCIKNHWNAMMRKQTKSSDQTNQIETLTEEKIEEYAKRALSSSKCINNNSIPNSANSGIPNNSIYSNFDNAMPSAINNQYINNVYNGINSSTINTLNYNFNTTANYANSPYNSFFNNNIINQNQMQNNLHAQNSQSIRTIKPISDDTFNNNIDSKNTNNSTRSTKCNSLCSLQHSSNENSHLHSSPENSCSENNGINLYSSETAKSDFDTLKVLNLTNNLKLDLPDMNMTRKQGRVYLPGIATLLNL
ncbi:hypothetical protein TRFO_42956 [Tritrichomonas foetus]|uniref:Myb-like DNA-binding domain containing protein n=1 Tax=Tritrichomonas foetus TaxID=1144522 RepID=A0A1J4KY15_9EUKA|nr:hypothetical protein TRFO_42956 [Tritrichomonas foetus]|eukprot:OHT14606.1 hypothetical protein TRFO_42956 [Tritrichomonas foetus]